MGMLRNSSRNHTVRGYASMLRHSLPDRNSCILGQLLLHLRTWPTISTHDLMRHALRGQPGFLHLDVLLYRSPAMPSNERDTADSAWRAHYDWRLLPTQTPGICSQRTWCLQNRQRRYAFPTCTSYYMQIPPVSRKTRISNT